MVNAVAPRTKAKIRCREIAEFDLDGVADLLTRGFPGRSRSYWMRGLNRLAARPLPPGYPRFGYVMENAGAIVGVLLEIYAPIGGPETGGSARCNLSSWYVEPAFRGYASLLVPFALRQKGVTYTNISPAPHTWPILEAQGFTRYCGGQFYALPALSPPTQKVIVKQILAPDDQSEDSASAEQALLNEHARYGCLSLLCRAPDGDFPFVFIPFRIRSGRIGLPCMRLVYCRNVREFVRFAGALGRFLLRRGTLAIVLDANGPIPGLRGVYRDAHGRKYCKGPDVPQLGDLAYTELVVFGP